ncbi:uncharacterized protein RAG0_17259 [Rhynchosporium agropyri]|uniref:Uncharacterized protein n=2 Tax=Rhynchosporium TaxID=38037 RepID=A0A1E1M5A8_RHYSE|nr:uncharacterized protein RAG0_17259 [Rhynchosporium agropyri]CZT44298.1 uncharacterized protein RSE6_04448 [Rhynchosporium secalis]
MTLIRDMTAKKFEVLSPARNSIIYTLHFSTITTKASINSMSVLLQDFSTKKQVL